MKSETFQGSALDNYEEQEILMKKNLTSWRRERFSEGLQLNKELRKKRLQS